MATQRRQLPLEATSALLELCPPTSVVGWRFLEMAAHLGQLAGHHGG